MIPVIGYFSTANELTGCTGSRKGRGTHHSKARKDTPEETEGVFALMHFAL
jgi:hypothetical protein